MRVKFLNQADLNDVGVVYDLPEVPGQYDQIVLAGVGDNPPVIARVVNRTWRIKDDGELQVDIIYGNA